MRVRFDADSLRVRVDEAGLTRLRTGAELSVALDLADGPLWRIVVLAGAHASLVRTGTTLRVTIPAVALDALSDRLPSREGIGFDCQRPGRTALRVTVDVDLRDPARARRPR